MARDPRITVRVDADASGATAGLARSQAAVTGFAAAAGTALANYADRAVRAAVRVAEEMVTQASNLEQSTGAITSVFGEFASEVERNAQRAARAVGLSQSAYQQLAAVLGSQLKNAGVPMAEVAAQTDRLIGLGADLAATYGGSVADAISAVSSLLRGERDPIERYAVTINQAAIDAYNAARGLDSLTGSAKTAADQQAALALLFEQTSAAQGSFAREVDTLAGAQAVLNATWANAQAALGTALLPFLTLGAQALSLFAEYAQENATTLQLLTVVLGATAAAVWLLNVAMNANPIGLVITAVGLLISILILLISNWESVVAAFRRGADQIAGFIDGIIGWIRDAIGWFGRLFGAANNANDASRAATNVAAAQTFAATATAPQMQTFAALSSPMVSPALSAASTSQVSATLRARERDSGGNTTIIVNGALDPQAVSRQIAGLLRGRNARIGLGAAAGVRA